MLTEARRAARVRDGELVPLERQDRTAWDHAAIAEGHALVRECLAIGRPGRYQLVYQVAAYFRARGVALPEPPFLDEVTLSFGLGDAPHYHVPLLVSPFGYTTYRGS